MRTGIVFCDFAWGEMGECPTKRSSIDIDDVSVIPASPHQCALGEAHELHEHLCNCGALRPTWQALNGGNESGDDR
jgi:hypothetical protein